MHLVISRAAVEVLERGNDVLTETRRENIFLLTKLVTRLPYNGVDDVQTGDFVFKLALHTNERDVMNDEKSVLGFKSPHNT